MFRMFDFRCNDCGTRFEALVDGTDHAECECGSSDTKKLISPVRFDYNSMWVNDIGTTANDKWNAAREKQMRAEQKAKRDHGSYSLTGQPHAFDHGEIKTVVSDSIAEKFGE